MRLLAFTLLALATAMAIQWSLVWLPNGMNPSLDGFTLTLIFVLPVAATVVLAFPMRIWNRYLALVAISSPFVSAALLYFIQANVLQRPIYLW